MAAPNRSAILARLHKVLKKHYGGSPEVPDRPVLEQLLFAACLENAPYDKSEAAFHALRTTFFDWNEVRVSSIKELSEVLGSLPDPVAAATSLRKILQSVFESTYSFDLEILKKPTLGQALQRLEKLQGVTPFSLACVTQWSLGGHSIPLDRGALDALLVLGVIDEKLRQQASVPGLERAIPKNKGVEFGGLLHQLSAEMVANPYSPNLHKLLMEIAPDAKTRLPKKPTKKEEAEAAAAQAVAAATAKVAARKAAQEAAENEVAAAKKAHMDKAAEKRAAAAAAAPKVEPSKKEPPKKAASGKKEPDAKKPPSAKSKPAAKKPPPTPPRKASASPVAKRKPR